MVTFAVVLFIGLNSLWNYGLAKFIHFPKVGYVSLNAMYVPT